MLSVSYWFTLHPSVLRATFLVINTPPYSIEYIVSSIELRKRKTEKSNTRLFVLLPH